MLSWMQRSPGTKSVSTACGPSGPAAAATHYLSQTEKTGPLSAIEGVVGSGSASLAAATGPPLNPTCRQNHKGLLTACWSVLWWTDV